METENNLPEAQILGACLKSRQAWGQARDLLEVGDFAPISKRVWDGLETYYGRDPDAQKAEPKIVYQLVCDSLSSKGHQEQLKDTISYAIGLDVSPQNVMGLALDLRRQTVAFQVAEKLLNGERADEDIELYLRLVEAEDLADATGEVYEAVNLNDLLEVIDPDKKIKFAPNSLNDRLNGGLVAGDSMIVGGRPNSGKSALCVTMMSACAYRGHKVLYIGNEEPVRKTIIRTISCLTGMTSAQLMQQPDKAMEIANQRGYGNIVYAHLSPGTPQEIKNLVRQHKPDLVIVDQLLNLKVGKAEGVERMEQSARAIRTIGGEFGCVTISVSQVGESGDNKLRLGMSDLYGSKTGLQGAADVILLLGNDVTYEAQHSRMLNLAKNKTGLTGETWAVRIDEFKSRIYDE